MLKRVLWLSRHPILGPQLAALQEMFGADVQVIQDPNPFASATEIKARFDAGKYDDLVAVAPLSTLRALTAQGLRPLWAEMKQVTDRNYADTVRGERSYRFIRFRRLKSVNMEFEEEP